MSRSKIQAVQFRRKMEGKTDYSKRLKLLKSGKPRMVIRKSLKNILVQIVEYVPQGDKVIASAHSSELKKLGWQMSCSNIPASYLTGYLLGKKAGQKKIKECILDSGLYTSVKGNRIYAALKGAIDAGMSVPASKEILPPEDRISGKHIAEFAKKIKGSKDFSHQFSAQNKSGVLPEGITKHFEEIKQKIR